MDETVNISFRYSEGDYVSALRAHYRSRLRPPMDVAVVIVLAACGAYLWYSSGLGWEAVACMTGSAILILMLFVAFFVIPPLAFRREPKFRDHYSLVFSQEGIHFRTEHIDSHLHWTLYSQALVDAHSYVLYYGTRQFTVIPKRVFQSADQQQVFERLLTQHVSKIVRR